MTATLCAILGCTDPIDLIPWAVLVLSVLVVATATVVFYFGPHDVGG